jgi:uncharacterized glyoxalase superfamily protein PhnB
MPDTAPNIFPALRYRDAPAAVRWLVEAFGFQELFVSRGPDGTIAHAELRLGPGIIMLGSLRDGRAPDIPPDFHDAPHSLYVYVEDVDAHHERARATGAEIVYGVTEMPYGSREYGARDLEGHHWSFGSYRPSASGH